MRTLFKAVVVSAAATAVVLSGSFARGQAYLNSPVADDVFYHFMPIAWRDSDNDAWRYGDFNGMTASLDYLQSLGVTAIWMNPIFPSAAYHGYQHGPADQIDSDFGTQAQFLNFVAQAKLRGIKVYLDFVAYGISHNSAYYTSAFNNPASPYDTWLAFTNASNTSYLGSVYNTWTGASVGFIHWDLRTAATSAQVTAWARKWLDPDNNGIADDGIAGYRFDHCWVQYNSGPDGWGYNLDDFWTPFFASLKALKPDVFNFGEQADWGTRGGEFLSQFDAMFTIPFQFAARNALASENASGLYSEMDGMIASAAAAGQGTFLGVIGTHDVDRLASAIGADSGSTIGKQKSAAAVLLLQPFPPVIYYGDELAMTGWKQNYGSDANDIPMREPFKWNAVAGPPMSNYLVRNSSAFNNRFSQDNDGRSVPEQESVAGSPLETHRQLIQLRKDHAALRRGAYTGITATDSRVWAFLRGPAPSGGHIERLIVAINLSGAVVSPNLSLTGYTLPPGGSPVTDVVTAASLPTITSANQSAYALTIPAYGFRVLSVNLAPPPPPVSRVDGLDIVNSTSGAQLALVQDTATNLGNNVSELNQLRVRVESDGLLIGMTGNLSPDGTALALFLDTKPGGQAVVDTSALLPPPGGLAELSGTLFDTGFRPDWLFFINGFGSNFYVDQVTLLETPGSPKTYRGSGVINSHSGLLTGGSNAGGIQVALDNTNTSGVTGSSVANAAAATKGIEMFLPFGELGLTGPYCGQFRVAAMIVRSSGSISNQHLPGLAGRSTDLGVAPSMPAIAGAQFALTSIAPTCPPPCAGDADASGSVTFADVTSVLANFGISYTPAQSTGPGDANHDGVVNFGDVTAVLANFGVPCA